MKLTDSDMNSVLVSSLLKTSSDRILTGRGVEVIPPHPNSYPFHLMGDFYSVWEIWGGGGTIIEVSQQYSRFYGVGVSQNPRENPKWPDFKSYEDNALFISDLSNEIGLTRKIYVTIKIIEFFPCLIQLQEKRASCKLKK